MQRYSRTEMLLGKNSIKKLRRAKVIVFGLGGVGGNICEALLRSGVENLTFVDKDIVEESNLNRQLIATEKTVGMDKVEAMKERLLEINSQANVVGIKMDYSEHSAKSIDLCQYDYIVDAIDTVSAKVLLIEEAKRQNINIISAMGAGNKLHPEMLELSNISKTSVCPLARVMRRQLKDRGIRDLWVVYSKELPIKPEKSHSAEKTPPGSTSFVPACAGLIIAGKVVRDLMEI